MTQQSTRLEMEKWHRWFAIDCNNQAWDLASKEDRDEDDTQLMVYAAFTAAFHWSMIGQPVNNARADVTLALYYHWLVKVPKPCFTHGVAFTEPEDRRIFKVELDRNPPPI